MGFFHGLTCNISDPFESEMPGVELRRHEDEKDVMKSLEKLKSPKSLNQYCCVFFTVHVFFIYCFCSSWFKSLELKKGDIPKASAETFRGASFFIHGGRWRKHV